MHFCGFLALVQGWPTVALNTNWPHRAELYTTIRQGPGHAKSSHEGREAMAHVLQPCFSCFSLQYHNSITSALQERVQELLSPQPLVHRGSPSIMARLDPHYVLLKRFMESLAGMVLTWRMKRVKDSLYYSLLPCCLEVDTPLMPQREPRLSKMFMESLAGMASKRLFIRIKASESL